MKNKINIFLMVHAYKTIYVYTASYTSNKIIVRYRPFFLRNKKHFYVYLIDSGKLIVRYHDK